MDERMDGTRKRLPRINDQIRAPRVRVVVDGAVLGVLPIFEARNVAREAGMDLVEVQPDVSPPVCRVMDWGKEQYDKKKRESQHRGSVTRIAEIQVRPDTANADVQVKARKALEFLQDGIRVKVIVMFSGREHAHRDLGEKQCSRIAEIVGQIGAVEKQPRMDGRQMHMILAPIKGTFSARVVRS